LVAKGRVKCSNSGRAVGFATEVRVGDATAAGITGAMPSQEGVVGMVVYGSARQRDRKCVRDRMRFDEERVIGKSTAADAMRSDALSGCADGADADGGGDSRLDTREGGAERADVAVEGGKRARCRLRCARGA
jgi:hypothetical protein